MYKITFKGRDMEPIFVDDFKGKLLADDFFEGTMPEKVRVKNIIFLRSNIKSIEKFDETSKLEDSEKSLKETHNVYVSDLHAFRKLTVEQKAKNLAFFRLLYWGFTQKDSEGLGLEEKAIEIQKNFFEQNPLRMYCDPILFKSLFESDNCNPTVLNISESQIRQDRFAEKHL